MRVLIRTFREMGDVDHFLQEEALPISGGQVQIRHKLDPDGFRQPGPRLSSHRGIFRKDGKCKVCLPC